MKLYVYADESGTFDKANNDIFVYAGVLVLGKEALDEAQRRYLSFERKVRRESPNLAGKELKACRLDPRQKKRAFSVLRSVPSTVRGEKLSGSCDSSDLRR